MNFTAEEIGARLNLGVSSVRTRIAKLGLSPTEIKNAKTKKMYLYSEAQIKKIKSMAKEYAKKTDDIVTMKELMKSLGLSRGALTGRMSKLNIAPKYCIDTDKRVSLCFTKAEAESLKSYSGALRGKNKTEKVNNRRKKAQICNAQRLNVLKPSVVYFRVSVLIGNHWIVKHAGLTQDRAEKIVSEYFDKGEVARMSACRIF